MDPLLVLLTFLAVITFCIIVLGLLAFIAMMAFALDDAHDDLHIEKDYLDEYKTKR